MQQQPGRWILLKQVSLSLGLFVSSGIIFRLEPSSINQMWLESQKPSSHPMSRHVFGHLYPDIFEPQSCSLDPGTCSLWMKERNCSQSMQPVPSISTCNNNRWRMTIHLKRWVTNLERQNSWLNQTTKSSLFCLWLHYCLQICIYIYT